MTARNLLKWCVLVRAFAVHTMSSLAGIVLDTGGWDGGKSIMVCDSSAFAQVLDTRGWDGNKSMLYDDFLKALHEYVDIKHRERGALYDMAASIF